MNNNTPAYSGRGYFLTYYNRTVYYGLFAFIQSNSITIFVAIFVALLIGFRGQIRRPLGGLLSYPGPLFQVLPLQGLLLARQT